MQDLRARDIATGKFYKDTTPLAGLIKTIDSKHNIYVLLSKTRLTFVSKNVGILKPADRIEGNGNGNRAVTVNK